LSGPDTQQAAWEVDIFVVTLRFEFRTPETAKDHRKSLSVVRAECLDSVDPVAIHFRFYGIA
jgi:hypothetical protein